LNDASVYDPFPTPFIDKVLESFGWQEAYSFMHGLWGYHQTKIALEDHSKATSATDWIIFNTVMTFGLKNAPAIFSRVVIAAFKEFIHKFL